MSTEKYIFEMITKNLVSKHNIEEIPDFDTSMKRGACTAVEMVVPLVATTIVSADLSSIFSRSSIHSSPSGGEMF